MEQKTQGRMSRVLVCSTELCRGAGELIADFATLKNKATEQYKTLQEKAQPVMKVIEDPTAVEKLKSSGDKEKNLEILRSEYDVSRFRA